jgi:peptidoglycan-associated lipoprotein
MKLASTSLTIAACAAALFSGCAKKPVRPDPSATALGPQSNTAGALTPSEVSVAPDTTLQPRDANGAIDDGNTIRGLLQPVYFDFDRSSIKPSERPKLQAAKDYVDKNPQYHLLVEGHCDWQGTAEYNIALGDRRASAAKKYLLSIGVPAEKVETLSKGSEEAVKGADDATRAKDRRDEIVVVKKP